MTNQEKNNQAKSIGKQIQSRSDGNFLITGDLDFETVPEILNASQSLFTSGQSITIDLSEVGSSNSAGLALLIEWMRVADSRKCSLKFQNLPDQMMQVAQLCGVDDKLPI